MPNVNDAVLPHQKFGIANSSMFTAGADVER